MPNLTVTVTGPIPPDVGDRLAQVWAQALEHDDSDDDHDAAADLIRKMIAA